MDTMTNIIIRLTVRNHPGVMSHITGLFSRRAFNLEAILCVPEGEGAGSVMHLLVRQDERLEQILKQLEKLYDVLEIRAIRTADPAVFERLSARMACELGKSLEIPLTT